MNGLLREGGRFKTQRHTEGKPCVDRGLDEAVSQGTQQFPAATRS